MLSGYYFAPPAMSSDGKEHEQPSSAAASSSSGRTAASLRYKGVMLQKWGSWVAEVRLPNSRERIWLGSHDTAEKAARAYDAAVLCLRSRGATFNFPDSLPRHTPPGRLTLEQIQEVAAQHARRAPMTAAPTRAAEPAEGTEGGGMLDCPEDPLAGFPSPVWTMNYGEEEDSPDDGGDGDGYSLWSFGPEDGPPNGGS